VAFCFIKPGVMKKLISLVVILLIGFNCLAQEKPSLSKAEKKLLRQKEKEQYETILAINTSKAIESGNFVLKADQLRSRHGVTSSVNSNLNFIAVLGKEAYVQTGNDSGVGFNGIGGTTVRGDVKIYTVDRNNNNGSYTIQFSFESPAASLTVIMHVNATGDLSTASVSSGWGGTLHFSGRVVPASESLVSTGMESY